MNSRTLGILGWSTAFVLFGTTAVLAWQLDRRLGIESRIRSDVGGLGIHRDLDAPGSPSVVILGDSRAAGLGEPEIEGWNVVNLGVPGQTTAEVLSRAGRDLVLLDPNAVVLITGINDLKSGEGKPAVNRAAEATRDIVRIAGALDQPILVIETWPQAAVGLRSALLPEDLPNRCNRLADELNGHPETQSAYFAAMHKLLGEDGLVRIELARDSLHLNQTGHRIVVETIENFLEDDSNSGR